VLCGLGLAPLALATVPAVFAGCFALGVGLSIVMVGYFTLLQRRTANELQGRVFAAAETALNIPYAASIGAGAALIATVGFRVMYLVNAVVLGLCGVYLLASRVRPVEIPEVIEELSDGARAGVEARPAAAETTRLPQGIVPPE
jgi:MFS family permease